MSIEHKAFIFNYQAFIDELADILNYALNKEEYDALVDFIEANMELIKDPYEGEMLDAAWRNLIETEDAHQYGDFALTKFYNPQDDIGLGDNWMKIQELLHSEGLDQNIILGKVFGLDDNFFDPGKQGSYFQSPNQVRENLQLINDLIESKPNVHGKLSELLEMLQKAFNVQQGLYITF